jgi:hypothetical protein
VADAGRDHVVVGGVLLQHHPHGAHVVPREAPIAARVEIAQPKMVGEAERDARHAVGHLPGDELDAPARRLVIEQDARHREHVVALAIVHRDVVTEHLRHAIGASWIERRLLRLRHLAHAPVHLTGRRLVETDAGIDLPDGLEHARHALRVVLAGEQRLIPGRGHERHGREVVELVRPDIGEETNE